MYDAELSDDRNQVDAKIDSHLAGFFKKKTPGVPFCPMFHFAPTDYTTGTVILA